ncbi:MAG: hypothetical protein R2776_01520 [Flavobacteriaceae bacterium]
MTNQSETRIDRFLKSLNHLKKHVFLIFVGISLAYLVFYIIYTFNESTNKYFNSYDKFFQLCVSLCTAILGAAIFSVALKYLQFLEIFKKEFSDIVHSEEFDKKLKNSINQITFSTQSLRNQSNIEEIWQNVTLCMYENEFEELNPRLRQVLKNDFFEKNNVSYYYKNFQLNYIIEHVTDKIVNIKEKTSATIVRPNKEEFNLDFWISILKDEDERTYSKIDLDSFLINDKKKTEEDFEIKDESDEKFKKTKYILSLSGEQEYHIEKTFEVAQNLDEDRAFGFVSNRIIDDISVTIRTSENIKIFFSETNGARFKKNNIYEGEMAFINRELMLPGEKYKIFIYLTS